MRKTVFIYEGIEYGNTTDLRNAMEKSQPGSAESSKSEVYCNPMQKYITTPEKLMATLEKYGVAIIPKVLDDKECDEMYSGMWDYFEHISQTWKKPLSRSDESTWREFYNLYPEHGMLIQHYGVGHAQVSWNLRQNPKLVDIYAELWGVKREELLVSFDGMSLSLPPERTNRGWFNRTWYHTDQSPLRPEFECVQSWVTSRDINEGDATLAVLEGSHIYHKEFAKRFSVLKKLKEKKKEKSDWYKFTEEEQAFYTEEKGCKPVRIVCGKGDAIYWDSRTAHCGAEPLKSRSKPNIRAIVYLCYIPRSLATKPELEKKKKAFTEMRSTSHWPHIISNKMFSKEAWTRGNPQPDITEINAPVLTELGKKLAGF